MSFWTSIDKATKAGFAVAWAGVAIGVCGQLFPNSNWFSLAGIVTTSIGLALRQRLEHLRKLDSAPRKLSAEQKSVTLNALRMVPKAALKIHFLGDDAESMQFAEQLKEVFEEAGFDVQELAGAISFKPRTGLSITVCEWDAANPTALGIQSAFVVAGLKTHFDAIMKQRESSIEICVHRKPPRIGSVTK